MVDIVSNEELADAQARIDAWVSAIRGLARAHRCAHKLAFSKAVKDARPVTHTNDSVKRAIDNSVNQCIAAGIPNEELVAIRTLIFG